MLCNILAIGDICGQGAVDYLGRILRRVKEQEKIHFVVANGENADGVGLLPEQAEAIFRAGVDVITLGNHSYNRRQIVRVLEENRYLLRPANYGGAHPGRGFGIFEGPTGLRIGVMNLIGRVTLDAHADNPLKTAAAIVAGHEAEIWLVDIHAEATSEKAAVAYHLDGTVSAVWGTHTHVPTADTRILPNGTGFVTDLGMVGAQNSIIGVAPEDSLNLFLGNAPRPYTQAPGPFVANMVRFTIDSSTGHCVELARVDAAE